MKKMIYLLGIMLLMAGAAKAQDANPYGRSGQGARRKDPERS